MILLIKGRALALNGLTGLSAQVSLFPIEVAKGLSQLGLLEDFHFF
jgi:hypothetical protein